MLFCMNETNLKRKEVRQYEKRQKMREFPQGEWGMGSKDPIQRKILQEPLSVQVDINRGIKEGIDFINIVYRN